MAPSRASPPSLLGGEGTVNTDRFAHFRWFLSMFVLIVKGLFGDYLLLLLFVSRLLEGKSKWRRGVVNDVFFFLRCCLGGLEGLGKEEGFLMGCLKVFFVSFLGCLLVFVDIAHKKRFWDVFAVVLELAVIHLTKHSTAGYFVQRACVCEHCSLALKIQWGDLWACWGGTHMHLGTGKGFVLDSWTDVFVLGRRARNSSAQEIDT